jgi:hypothetical protein
LASSFLLAEKMLLQFISAVCIILAILTIIGVISPTDAGKAIGKGLLMLLCVFMAVCTLRSLLASAITMLLRFLKAITPWLVVTVLVAAGAMVFLRLLLRRFGTEKEDQDSAD